MKRLVGLIMCGCVAVSSAGAQAQDSSKPRLNFLEYRFSGDPDAFTRLEKSLAGKKIRMVKPGPDLVKDGWDCIAYNSQDKDNLRYVCKVSPKVSDAMATSVSAATSPTLLMQAAAPSIDCPGVACTFQPPEASRTPCATRTLPGLPPTCFHILYGPSGNELPPNVAHVCDVQ